MGRHKYFDFHFEFSIVLKVTNHFIGDLNESIEMAARLIRLLYVEWRFLFCLEDGSMRIYDLMKPYQATDRITRFHVKDLTSSDQECKLTHL
jgi:hypothetical protein